ncbi:transketolase [candidate division WOR-1 bacterium RIFOXYB2_FULL_37_13]|uniref:Transketolase n=1 Tax=candidate division WOR-1 bacterium RIFOXYB2_FULL_37_13 TaxID=1802579 RepID=A0A1F4SUY2_UNCSA|nr:MAG: transketolase [candidate division WOR-1 bacterium RIFOXYB2_FULL_37_13]
MTNDKKSEATRDAYGKILAILGKENPNIVVLDADLAVSTKTAIFRKEFPDRFFDMGIAEQDMIGTAAGLAASGKIAFASTFAVFGSGRTWDQIRMSCAYTRLNVKIVVTHGGITTGEDGASHQANEDLAIMRVIPNMTVIVPADSIETVKVIRAVADFSGPVYVRLSRIATPIVYENTDYKFKIGKGIVMREGKDVSLFACGIMVAMALEAAENLGKENISAEVINLHTIKPIDQKLVIKSASKTGAVVTCEEHSIIGGLGSAVSEILAENYPAPIKRIGVKDTFGESGNPKDLLVKYGLTSQEIVKAAKSVIARKI